MAVTRYVFLLFYYLFPVLEFILWILIVWKLLLEYIPNFESLDANGTYNNNDETHGSDDRDRVVISVDIKNAVRQYLHLLLKDSNLG